MTSRAELRQLRRNLSSVDQRGAARSLCRIIARQLFFQNASKIALYFPVDGEISPLPLLDLADHLGKLCYLPIIRKQTMSFLPYVPDETPLRSNQFGIPEPISNDQSIAPWMLDIVCMPLVGFDTRGNRIGMGKGYYDRTLGNMDFRWRKPILVGLAHSFQQTEIEPKPWDVPLDKIVTEKTMISRPW